MAEKGVFSITEYKPGGDVGEAFAWTAAKTAVVQDGGAFAAPRKPWTIGLKQRTVRTDYPGARFPSEQIMGPAYEPQTIAGEFHDRFNFVGYANNEMRRLEGVVERGNKVRVEFEGQSFWGVIQSASFPYRWKHEVHYSLTFSIHGRADSTWTAIRAPQQPETARQAIDNANMAALGLARAQNGCPTYAVKGSLFSDASKKLDTINRDLQAATDVVDGKLRASPVSQMKALSTKMGVIKGGCFSLLGRTVSVRSDVELGVRTATSVLDFEAWLRGVGFWARLLAGRSLKFERAFSERESPQALRLYRPRKGESLRAISSKFYGTPDGWRLIADRNALSKLELEGNETLVIPERESV